MGLFYSNMTVYRVPRNELMVTLRRLRRTAFVSPDIQCFTVVFDEAIEDQDSTVIEEFGSALTGELSCPALAAMLHDDDVLYLWLFQNGKVCDRYDSLPQYFDPVAQPGPPEGGNSELLCKAFERPDRQQRVEQVLRANLLEGELPEIRGEFERHQALAAELGIPAFVAGVCYSSIAGGYVPEEFIPQEFWNVVFEPVPRN
jgi:hypothetical protein